MTTPHDRTDAARCRWRLGRRRWLGFAVGVAALAGGARRCWYTTDHDAAALRNLAARDAAALAALISAMLPPSSDRAPKVLASYVRDIDGYLTGLPSSEVAQLRALLALVEQVVPAAGGHLARFSDLSYDDRVSLVAALQISSAELLRLGFRSLKALIFLAHYRRPAAWAAIGYEGPHLPGGGASLPSSARYAALLAAPGTLPR